MWSEANGSRVGFRGLQCTAKVQVCAASNGVRGCASSRDPSIPADLRCVALPGDKRDRIHGDTHVFRVGIFHDLQTGAASRLHLHSKGVQGSASGHGAWISADDHRVTR